jgi:glutamate racemase
VRASQSGRIGVIGTAGTIRSGAYERAIRQLRPAAVVVSAAAPLFVPLVEEGWLEHDATRLVAAVYLTPLREAGIDTLVLGCTHYPLLKPLLARVLGPDITLIDSAEETAATVARHLKQQGLAAPGGARGHVHYCVSDAVETFCRVGGAFLGRPVEDVELVAF